MATKITVPQTGREARQLIREGRFHQPTSGVAPHHVQANVAILPRDVSFEFLLFCQRNPKPCPVVEVIEAGQVEAALTAPGSDIRTDVSQYRVFKNGPFVFFFISLSTASALLDSGTRCSRRCLVWAEGFTQMPLSKSNMDQVALSTSLLRAPVSM